MKALSGLVKVACKQACEHWGCDSDHQLLRIIWVVKYGFRLLSGKGSGLRDIYHQFFKHGTLAAIIYMDRRVCPMLPFVKHLVCTSRNVPSPKFSKTSVSEAVRT